MHTQSWSVLVPLAAILGCSFNDFGPQLASRPGDVPGARQLHRPVSITCNGPQDCEDGEQCEQGMCQPSRCHRGPYESAPPLGRRGYLAPELELLVTGGGDRHISVHQLAEDGATAAEGHDLAAPAAIGDLCTGRFTATGEEMTLAVLDERPELVQISQGAAASLLTLPFTPVAIAGGDIDADGVDELVAVDQGQRAAVCDLDQRRCEQRTLEAKGRAMALALGDIDGDGAAEAVIHYRTHYFQRGVRGTLVLWNLDARQKAQPEFREQLVDVEYESLAIAELDGQRGAELVLLEQRKPGQIIADECEDTRAGEAESPARLGGHLENPGVTTATARGDCDRSDWLGIMPKRILGQSRVHVYRFDREVARLVETAWGFETIGTAVELAALPTDQLPRHDILVLGSDGQLAHHTLRDTRLLALATHQLTAAGKPRHLALRDVDGDSTVARLVAAEPELVEGRPTPLFALSFPPYDLTYSQDDAEVRVGDRNMANERTNHTIGATVSHAIGVSGQVPVPVIDSLKVSLGNRLSQWVEYTKSLDRGLILGRYFHMEPLPAELGRHYGGVVLAAMCFHRYTYELEDPRARLGAAGTRLAITAPLEGEAVLWSTARYNALAEARGDLPLIHVSTTIGDPKSYPEQPTSLDGVPLAGEELVFPSTPLFRVSDAGEIAWWLNTSELGVHAELREMSFAGTLGSLGAEYSHVNTEGDGYTVSIGAGTAFSGEVPGIVDRIATPESEYTMHAYSFRPIMYRHRYIDAEGLPAGLFALTYTVSR
jgi:hypothetical protein